MCIAAPGAPVDLRATVNPDTPTTYSFMWNPPINADGLVEYELTCQPEEGVAKGLTFDSSITEGSISDLRYNLLYICSVRVRNMATYSQPSNQVSFTVPESGMCYEWVKGFTLTPSLSCSPWHSEVW